MVSSSSIAQPFPEAEIPACLQEIAHGKIQLIWINELGGTTAHINGIYGLPPGFYYAKWNPRSTGLSLSTEVKKMRWLKDAGHATTSIADFRTLPEGELLITRDEGATSAVFPQWVKQPDIALRAIAVGLKRLHALDINDCTYSWSLQERLNTVKNKAVRRELKNNAPSIDRLVVCHGDPCAPNTLISPDGEFAGTIDVENLGLADRWADIAVALMSLSWNYPDYDSTVFWETYGVEPDQRRIEYYQSLWNAQD